MALIWQTVNVAQIGNLPYRRLLIGSGWRTYGYGGFQAKRIANPHIADSQSALLYQKVKATPNPSCPAVGDCAERANLLCFNTPDMAGLLWPAPVGATAMNPSEKHSQYRTFGSTSFAQADEELRRYWRSRTPAERMEALENLRIAIYGEEIINARIPRVFGVPESSRR